MQGEELTAGSLSLPHRDRTNKMPQTHRWQELSRVLPMAQAGHTGSKGYLKFLCVKALQPKSMMLRPCPCISSQRLQMTGPSSLPAYRQLHFLAIQGEGTLSLCNIPPVPPCAGPRPCSGTATGACRAALWLSPSPGAGRDRAGFSAVQCRDHRAAGHRGSCAAEGLLLPGWQREALPAFCPGPLKSLPWCFRGGLCSCTKRPGGEGCWGWLWCQPEQ